MSNIIQLSKPCAFCDSMENVQLFAGLMLCGNCQENIRITNPGMFEANDQIEQKGHLVVGLLHARADGDHHDDGRAADEHAQHRQDRASFAP